MSRPAFVERERKRVVARSRIGQVMFGVQDGITTTIGIVSSMVAGHQSNAVTLFVGAASAFAGMFSMAIGSYLASTAELDVARVELARERARIARDPAHEIDELRQIYRSHGMTAAMARGAARRVATDPRRMLDVMASEEFGIDATPHDDPMKDAFAIAVSFLVGAGIPIAPYALLAQPLAFPISLMLASTVLVVLGAFKARVIGLHPWRSALQTFAFGASASGLGYVMGVLLPRIIGIHAQP